MATSLAQQLKKLAAPQTQRLHPDCVVASLLFEPRQASQLERDDFYSVGLTGLDELEVLLPSFSSFRATLFSDSSKLFERSIQTAEVNKKLDHEIAQFLSVVSPFLLLKPALKALEWLVNRYQIHLYNADDLMKCVLPYHETNVFVRIVQLLDLKGPKNRWSWLAPNQKSGVHLASLTLYNHCISDIGFFEFLCHTAREFAKCSSLHAAGLMRPIVLFYMSTVVGVLECCHGVSETMLTAILSHILHGLKSHLDDYVASSYLVLAHLVQKTVIHPSIMEPLVAVLLKLMPEGLKKEAVQCLSAIMDSQRLDRLGIEARRALRVPQTIDVVVELSQQCEIQHVVQVVTRGLICLAMKGEDASAYSNRTTITRRAERESYKKKRKRMRAATAFIKKVNLAEDNVAAVVQVILETYLKRRRTPGNALLAQFSCKLLVTLEKRYSVAFDRAFEVCLQKLDDRERKVVRKLICGSHAKHMLLLPEGIIGSISASLNHPNPVRRKLAVEMLDVELTDMNLTGDTLTNIVVTRLGDDVPEVVSAMLGSHNLISSVDPSAIVSVLLNIASKRKLNQKWLNVRCQVLELLSNPSLCTDSSIDQMVLFLLPLLFPTSVKELELSKLIAYNGTLAPHPLIGPFWEYWKNVLLSMDDLTIMAECHTQLMDAVCSCLSNLNVILKTKFLQLLMDTSQSMSNYPHYSLVVVPILSAEIVVSTADPEEQGILAKMVSEFISSRIDGMMTESNKKANLVWASVIESYTTCEFLEAVGYTRSKKDVGGVGICSLIFSLAKIIRNIRYHPNCATSSIAYKLQNGFFKLFTHFANGTHHFPMGSEPFKILLRYWIQTCFQMQDTWMSFLIRLIVEGLVENTPLQMHLDSCILEVRSLHLLTNTIHSVRSPQQGNAIAVLSDALPVMLVLAGSHFENIRNAALDCIDSLANGGWIEPRFLSLLEGILNYKTEIQHDPNIIKTVMANFVPLKHKQHKHSELNETCLDVIVSWINDESVLDIVKDGLVEYLENVNSSGVLCDLLPFLDGILKTDVSILSSALHTAAVCIIRMFNVSTIKVFRESTLAEGVLLQALNFQHCSFSTPEAPSLQMAALDQCTKDYFRALPRISLKQSLLNTLIRLQVESTNILTTKKIARTLKRLLFDGKQIACELQDRRNAFGVSSKSVREVKGRMSSGSSTPNSKTSPSEKANNDSEMLRKRMLVILEAIQGKRHLANCAVLIPVLFAHLKRCLDTPDSADYDKQLLLVCLLKCCNSLSESGDLTQVVVGQSQFNIELVIQCIRSTSNPRIHHHALLLLADLATLFPEYVLHNAMSIFTFMGANVFRHDDSYSFSVITKTVSSIVPAILKNCQEIGDLCEKQKLLTLLTRVFVDALPDIPEHRRIPLFGCYLSAAGSNDHLWLIIAIILQSYATWDNRAVAPNSAELVLTNQAKHAILDFAHRFCHRYLSNEQVMASICLIKHIMSMSETVPAGEVVGEELYIQLYSTKHRHHYMLLTVEFVSSLLSSDQFLNQLVETAGSVNQSMYELLLHHVLECLHHFITISKQDPVVENPSAGRFWKLMVHRMFELLDKTASLVPEEAFVDVVRTLMLGHGVAIQCKAIEMLIAKLQRLANKLKVQLYIRIIPELLSVLHGETETEDSLQSELIYNKQMALLALKLMIRRMAGTYPDAFKEVLTRTMELTCGATVHEHLRSSGLLCLAELCQVLQANIIVHLPVILPAVLVLIDDIDRISKNELLLMSVITAVHRIVESFSHFLSPYLQSILMKVCCLSTLFLDSLKSPMTTRLKAIRQNLAQDISLRILLPAIQSCYHDAALNFPNAIQFIAATLNEAIRCADQNAVVWHHVLFEFFMTVLDYRSEHPMASDEQIRNVENWIVEPLLTLVVKMSETTFRPFFIKLFDWSTREGVPVERALVFYFVANRIADRLKSLFVLFAGHFIRNAATLLNQNNTSKTDPHHGDTSFSPKKSDHQCLQLVGHVLDCLYKCFLYDNEGFLNQERFETLLDPLVDQIENGVDGAEYDQHITDHLIPCIGQFAIAASSDSLWKTLSYKVLLKTRNSSPKVRVASLQVTRTMAEKLGEEFITLLPETVPFLAELMEDESEEVEKLCQDVIADMEVIVGEPLQKYFSS